MAQNDAPIRVALLGAGTVGSQTARLLVEQADELEARIGRRMELVGIATLDPVDAPWIDQSIVTNDASELVTRADIVIELIGGIEPARTFILKAIENGAAAIAPGTMDWLGLALVAVVLPAVLCWAFGAAARRLGWIKDGDLKLN